MHALRYFGRVVTWLDPQGLVCHIVSTLIYFIVDYFG